MTEPRAGVLSPIAASDWSRDRALRVVRLARVTVQRHVGLLQRRQHQRKRFTEAIRQYFELR